MTPMFAGGYALRIWSQAGVATCAHVKTEKGSGQPKLNICFDIG